MRSDKSREVSSNYTYNHSKEILDYDTKVASSSVHVAEISSCYEAQSEREKEEKEKRTKSIDRAENNNHNHNRNNDNKRRSPRYRSATAWHRRRPITRNTTPAPVRGWNHL